VREAAAAASFRRFDDGEELVVDPEASDAALAAVDDLVSQDATVDVVGPESLPALSVSGDEPGEEEAPAWREHGSPEHEEDEVIVQPEALDAASVVAEASDDLYLTSEPSEPRSPPHRSPGPCPT